jgi:hypothetical protein
VENIQIEEETECFYEEGVPDFNLLQKREQIDLDILIEGRAKGIPAIYEGDGRKLWDEMRKKRMESVS